MSEFVECQNCARKFFAENIECPYCRGGGTGEPDAVDQARRILDNEASGRIYGTLFRTFNMVLFGIAILSLWAIGRPHPTSVRVVLGVECLAAVALFFGSLQRRRWVPKGVIAFLLFNAALGVLSMLQRGRADSLAWGPGPLILLIFLIPFLTTQARERYWR